jgi:hypothetical protein
MFEGALERSPGASDNLDYRTTLERRLRRRGPPNRPRFINSDVVPNNRPAIMLTHRVREQPLFVPILTHSGVGDPLECQGRWRANIGNQHRLPNNQYTDSRIAMLVDQLLDCGGPPQAGCSSRRQQRDEPNRTRRAVEAILDG